MKAFLLVGLTGSIATGKSTVSAMFEKLGAVIIDADKLAREVVEPGEPALAQIVEEFGRDVLQPDGTLDRKKLGAVVFGDAARRKRLEQITHPAIRDRFVRRLADLEARGFEGLVFWDAPVMIESGGHKQMQRLVVVATDEGTQLTRLCARDSIDVADAERKIKSQMPVAEKAKLADYVIDNSGERSVTETQVRRVFDWLCAELAVAYRAVGRGAPLAVLFPVNMGHYAANRLHVAPTFQRLSRDSGFEFVAYQSRPSGNFVYVEDRTRATDAAVAGERLLGLPCLTRSFPDLIRVDAAVPEECRSDRGSVVLRRETKDYKVIAVFFSSDIPVDARQTGRINDRVDALCWPSPRDAICLYDRPPKNGSVAHARNAILNEVRGVTAIPHLNATGRAISVVRDILAGNLTFDSRSGTNAEA